MFYIVKGFDPRSLTYSTGLYRHPEPCKKKFSAHVVVKHKTHLFKDHSSLSIFLEVLQQAAGWEAVSDFVDLGVYNRTQQFRTPCASKAPDINNPDTDPCNVLLPVNCVTGEQDVPMITPHRRWLHMSPKLWLQYLVTTFHEGVDAKSFAGALCAVSGCMFSSSCSSTHSLCHLFLQPICMQFPVLHNFHLHPSLEEAQQGRKHVSWVRSHLPWEVRFFTSCNRYA
jgi:hypothetical protein